MNIDLSSKVAIVTGASRGIGQATALALVASGAAGVVMTSRRMENLDTARRELIEMGAPPKRLKPIEARADSDSDAARAVAEAIAEFGSCDILVNNAGTNPSAGPLMDVDMGAVDKTWAVNQRGPLVWAREAYRAWMKENGGVIVNVASVGGIRPTPLIGAYNVSKAAIIHLTHQLAYELAPGVRVNAVAPGVVKTRLAEMLWKDNEDQAASTHPLGRLGEPADIASAIAFLCSDLASWITGVVLPIDGGVSGASGSM